MNDTHQLSEEMAAGSARLRIDVLGGEPREHVLDDMSFMNYRLADVRIAPEVTLAGTFKSDATVKATDPGRTVEGRTTIQRFRSRGRSNTACSATRKMKVETRKPSQGRAAT